MLGGVLFAVATLTGCDNFENPVRWEESPLANDLPGSWRAVDGEDAGVAAQVTRQAQGILHFELTFPEKTPATSKSDKYKHRATFDAELLGSASVNILQIRMSSYEEFEQDGQSLGTAAGTGYRFRLVTVSPEAGLRVHHLDRTVLGRLAEEAFAQSGLEIDAQAVTSCLSDEMTLRVWGEFWDKINDQLTDAARADLVAALETGGDSVEDFERGIAELEAIKVDPYKELARIRTCVARHLPSQSLEQLFRLHSDLVFSENPNLYVRQ